MLMDLGHETLDKNNMLMRECVNMLMDLGHETLDNGHWTLDKRQWTLDTGH